MVVDGREKIAAELHRISRPDANEYSWPIRYR